jgi:Phosphofructokinase
MDNQAVSEVTRRIGVLTSGGDCPGLNAVLRGVTKAAEKLGWESIGFLDGFEGLLPPPRYIVLDHSRTAGIMQQGGTILGTTNRGHFVVKVGAGEKTQVPAEIIEKARKTLADLEIDGLIVVGGDGSLTTALQLQEAGFSMIGVPKTIDNDLEATSMTFGFDSAVACVTDALDRLHSTAMSHKRVLVLEVMVAMPVGLRCSEASPGGRHHPFTRNPLRMGEGCKRGSPTRCGRISKHLNRRLRKGLGRRTANNPTNTAPMASIDLAASETL